MLPVSTASSHFEKTKHDKQTFCFNLKEKRLEHCNGYLSFVSVFLTFSFGHLHYPRIHTFFSSSVQALHVI
ncbi:hypothetical protein RJT34_02123 [Clitoria ternatea]|uniref:Uncharacterized protein n=1 Tax=Clitoria ternatea TaxID=43366 RepID=A0AAN9Q1J3_CLITE